MSEERPRDMLLLFMTLVLLLHLWLLTVLMEPEQEITQPEPLVMEVSLIAISAPKPAVQPPKPAPAPPPEKKPPPKQPPKPKPVVKKPPPVAQEAPDFAPFEPATPAPQNTQPTTTTNTTAISSSNAVNTQDAPAFTEANFRANYAHNPKPDYPAIARSRSWQGKVLLRVKVSAAGLSDDVTVEQSSGHEILDESAVEAVKKWRFIPAKRGDTAVASSVIVPIDFKLRN